jgi:hypothetical protein
MALGWVGIEGIADILDVSEGRVRQLIGQEGFPRPVVTLGPRNRVWSSSSIRAYRRSREEATTLSLAMLPKATAPLPRVVDDIFTVTMEYGYQPENVYVRAWQGDGYVIALLASVEPSPGISNKIESFVGSIAHQLPLVLGNNVCWLQDMRHTSPAMTSNVVLTEPTPGDFRAPTWSNVPYDDLVAAVGSAVEIYPAGTLTEENVRRYRLSGSPIEIPANEVQIASRVEDLRLLAAAPLTDEQREYAQDLAAQVLRWIDQDAERTDGRTNDPEWREEWRDGSSGILWAVRRRSRRLTAEEHGLVEKYFTDGPVDPDLAAATIDSVIEWIKQVDEASAAPDERANRAARRVAWALTYGLRDEARSTAYQTYLNIDLDGRIVHLSSNRNPGVDRYVSGRRLATILPADRRREHRLLAMALGEDHGYEIRFGRDLFGNHIARNTVGSVAILWPGEAPPATAADQIYLDGKDDAIATLLVDGKPAHLVPRIDPLGTWKKGYSGGSSSDVVTSIINYLTASGLPVNQNAVRALVRDHQRPETVTVDIAELLETR